MIFVDFLNGEILKTIAFKNKTSTFKIKKIIKDIQEYLKDIFLSKDNE